MRVSIRALSIATLIFWILLIANVALAAYSISQLDFNFGEAQFAQTPDGQIILSLPLYIGNRGYYNLNEFQFSTIFSDSAGLVISESNSFIPNISHGENITIIHNVTLNTDRLLDETEQYLFNDYSITASITAGLKFADLLPAQISTNLTFPLVTNSNFSVPATDQLNIILQQKTW